MNRKKLSHSKSDCQIESLKLKTIDKFLNGNQLKRSNTVFCLDDVRSPVDEEGASDKYYWSNCDASVWMRSCEKEVIEPIDGVLIGEMPTWLNGVLLRNGPGSLKVGKYMFDHLFDSSAMLHRFEIRDGKVTYKSKFVQTEAFKRNRKAQRIVVTEFGTQAVPDPCHTIFQRVAAIFNPTSNFSDNTITIYPIGDEYYTFAEVPVIHKINPTTLDTEAKVQVSDFVNIVHHTSHPHVMKDGTVFNLGTSITHYGPAYVIVCFPPQQISIDESGKEQVLSMFDQAKIVGLVPSRWILNPSYMHTFGITENYFIVIEQPLAISLVDVITNSLKKKSTINNLKWHENENTLIHLVSRATGTLEKTFVTETFFFLHVINQFETRDGDYVVLDICCYRDSKMIDCMYVNTMKDIHKNPDYANLFRGRPLRFVLPLKSVGFDISPTMNLINTETVNQNYEISRKNCDYRNEERWEGDSDNAKYLLEKASAYKLFNGTIFIKPELLCDLGCETPRINYESCLGIEYRYFYAISSDVDLDNPGTIIKVDVVTKTKKTWNEDNLYPSEPIFVPHPNAKDEDDGVVISALVWGCNRETEVGLLVLDAKTFTEVARVTFKTPSPVPKCLHGWFTLNK